MRLPFLFVVLSLVLGLVWLITTTSRAQELQPAAYLPLVARFALIATPTNTATPTVTPTATQTPIPTPLGGYRHFLYLPHVSRGRE